MTDSFGARIRQARQASGLSQAALARRIGITPSALNQIELEHSDVYAARIRDVARVLHVDGRFLLGLSDEMEEVQQ
jgi:transcriptional regulator with XRE-family HTH domain